MLGGAGWPISIVVWYDNLFVVRRILLERRLEYILVSLQLQPWACVLNGHSNIESGLLGL